MEGHVHTGRVGHRLGWDRKALAKYSTGESRMASNMKGQLYTFILIYLYSISRFSPFSSLFFFLILPERYFELFLCVFEPPRFYLWR